MSNVDAADRCIKTIKGLNISEEDRTALLQDLQELRRIADNYDYNQSCKAREIAINLK